MNDIDLRDSRAEDVQPQGFVPSHLAEPMLRDRDARTTALEYVATSLGEIRLAADLIASPGNGKRVESRGLAETISAEAGRLQRLVKALATGALLLALVTVAVVAGPSSGRAEAATVAPASAAMEAPQPDPVASAVAKTVSVVLDRAYVTARVPVTTTHRTPRGYKCASVWGPTSYGQGFIGRGCSLASTFTVPVTLDARYVPLGRSTLRYTDDVAPMNSPVGTVTLVARRLSRFGVGVWTPTQYGDGLTVTATLYANTPSLGRWTPQQASPVKVQEFLTGRWVTVGAGTTNRYGRFLITVIVGGGPHTLRVHRDAGANVGPTDGTAHDFYLYPTDVPDGII